MEERKLSEQELSQQQNHLQELVDIAFEDGLSSAIEKVKKMNNPYLLDSFHDLLADRLYKELIERNKLKEL
jgi:hypothetical protein